MANAIKKISVQRGYDVTRYALNCFGGAGGQHACLVANSLGMTKVLIHPFSSLLSAYGMGLADIRATRQQAIEEPLGDGALSAITTTGGRLGEDARREVAGQGVPERDIVVHVRAHIRYAGTDTALVVPAFARCATGVPSPACGRGTGCGHAPTEFARSLPPPHPSPASGGGSRARQAARACPLMHRATSSLAAMKAAFETAHKARFGFIDESKQLVVEAVSVEAVGGGAKFAEPVLDTTAAPLPRADSHHPLLFRRDLARRGGVHARAACARAQGHGSGHRDGTASDRRGRGRLARRDHRQEPSRAGARRAAGARQRHRHRTPIR